VSPVFSLLVTSFYTPTFLAAQGGLTQAEAALVSGIESGAAWYGMHTTTFPTGEIGTSVWFDAAIDIFLLIDLKVWPRR
jgi:hypothetical protein